MNQNKYAQKQCAINKNIKKNSRGPYNKVSKQVKFQILNTMMSSYETLSQISQQFQVNKETIRSFYKKLNHRNLYFNLQWYLVYKYLHSQEFDIQQLEREQISRLIKKDIDYYYQDQKLEQILNEIQKRREQSKSKKKKDTIQFNSKNRRIIPKIVNFIMLAVAAAKNNTDFDQGKTTEEFYQDIIFQYLPFDPGFSNDQYMQSFEQESSQYFESFQTETRLYFRDLRID